MAMLWDMHIHLDFFRDPRETARIAETLGLGLFCMTVTPRDHERVRPLLEDMPNVFLGVGLHPWWIADGRCDFEDAIHTAELLKECPFAGEIGLDASPKHVPEGSLPAQAAAFEVICKACAETGTRDKPKVLSIHSVKAAGLTLDILERTGCLDRCSCIFHWFTGSSDELNRAIGSGCMFSVNEMMLRTRRGREYARQIPADRLLLETDLPPGRDIPFDPGGIASSLEHTLAELQAIRGMDLRSVIIRNTSSLLHLEDC